MHVLRMHEVSIRVDMWITHRGNCPKALLTNVFSAVVAQIAGVLMSVVSVEATEAFAAVAQGRECHCYVGRLFLQRRGSR
eukprot:6213551-Pleurochrysis_carterae.AAC.2